MCGLRRRPGPGPPSPRPAAAHAGWAGDARSRAAWADAPEAGEVGAKAGTHCAAAEGDLEQRGTVRVARTALAKDAVRHGRAEVAAEHDRTFREHASEGVLSVPVVGEWLAGKLYGTARNSAPDVAADPAGEGSPPRRAGPDWGGP